METVDLEALVDSVDIEEVLIDLGVEVLGSNGRGGISIMCPNPMHLDRHPSCNIHATELMWHCFGCHDKGTIIDIVERFKDIERPEAIAYLNTLIGLEENPETNSVKERFEEKDMPEFQLSSHFRRDWENATEEILDFIKRRKFSLILFDKYAIGYNAKINSLTLPIVYKRKIINIGERFLDPNAETKIKYKSDSPLSQCVWGVFEGYDNLNPFFTEGVFDAVRMREAGYNAYALLSNQLSDAKLRFLNEHFKGEFTIVPDNDKGGLLMVDAWKRQLHNADVNIVEIEGYKDVDEMPLDKIHSAVRKRVSLISKLMRNIETEEEICETIDR